MKPSKAIIELSKIARADDRSNLQLYFSSRKQEDQYVAELSIFLKNKTQVIAPLDVITHQEITNYPLPNRLKKLAEKMDLSDAVFEAIPFHSYRPFLIKRNEEEKVNDINMIEPLRITTSTGEYFLDRDIASKDITKFEMPDNKMILTKEIFESIVKAQDYADKYINPKGLHNIHLSFLGNHVLVYASNQDILYREKIECQSPSLQLLFSPSLVPLLKPWFNKNNGLEVLYSNQATVYLADYKIVVPTSSLFCHPLETLVWNDTISDVIKLRFDRKKLNLALKQFKAEDTVLFKITKENAEISANSKVAKKYQFLESVIVDSDEQISFNINPNYLSRILSSETEDYFDCLLCQKKALIKETDSLYKILMLRQLS
jgi:hypothetical protein